jgi:2-oxoglutarate dehydrogenase E2 component (dihydrolipoamide succinyltransferase)
MTIEIKVPALPESVSDATVSAWHKKVGDSVAEGENLLDLETDKVVLEVPAPVSGTITAIHFKEGSVVKATQVLASLEPREVKKVDAPKAPESKPAAAPVEAVPAKAAPAVSADLSPSARRAVAETAVDPASIEGSGKKGRITKEDVWSKSAAITGNRIEERVPMSRLRQRIAERLLSVQQNAAILTTFNEVNMQAVMELRSQYKDVFEKKHGIKLGFMSFFTKAVVEALKRFPTVNAFIDGTDVVYHAYQDVGVAVSTEKGLVVPILRNAEKMSFADIEKSIRDLSQKARDAKLTMEEMTGGTFTITNGGTFGSLMSTPIINPPQSAILGMHAIKDRPIVENGQIVIRPMMYLALSYDHRIIDGKDSVQFLVTIKELIEDPTRLLLEV